MVVCQNKNKCPKAELKIRKCSSVIFCRFVNVQFDVLQDTYGQELGNNELQRANERAPVHVARALRPRLRAVLPHASG